MTCFKDCPTRRGYDMCTCDMSGEESVLVEWCIQDQEGALPWWNIIARLSILGHPEVPVVQEEKNEL